MMPQQTAITKSNTFTQDAHSEQLPTHASQQCSARVQRTGRTNAGPTRTSQALTVTGASCKTAARYVATKTQTHSQSSFDLPANSGAWIIPQARDRRACRYIVRSFMCRRINQKFKFFYDNTPMLGWQAEAIDFWI